MQQIWGALARAVNDDTLIDEAIGIAVQAHDDDPDAHLEAGQAMTTHRAAAIIDHLAESVVNDKLATVSRTYTAIVGSGNAGDYNTIEDALAFVVALGGGSIFLCAGEYYIAGETMLPHTVSLYGADRDTTIIHTDYDNDKYFHNDYGAGLINQSINIQGLTFHADSPLVFEGYDNDSCTSATMNFTDCVFRGAGAYLHYPANAINIDRCVIYLTTTYAISNWANLTITNTNLLTDEVAGTLVFLDTLDDSQFEFITLFNITSFNITARPIIYFLGSGFGWVMITYCVLRGWDATEFRISLMYMGNCAIYNIAAGYFNFGGSDSKIISCMFALGTGNKLRLTANSTSTTAIFNTLDTDITDAGTGNIIRYNGALKDFYTLAGAGTACDYLYNRYVTHTPTGSHTLTTTVPRAGELRTLKILTSGVNTYTMTFGGGFKTTGTLATGSTSSRIFIVSFISDGTNLIETARTVAITA